MCFCVSASIVYVHVGVVCRVQDNGRPSTIFRPKHSLTDQTFNHLAIYATYFLVKVYFNTL